MFCYHCGALLAEYDYCTVCGAEVKDYRKILGTANRLYNDGLEKAKVRDLSGAVRALKQCLKLNKNHIEARNLLGVVFFEMGEVPAALAEWVLSENLRKEKNIASEYIALVQNNRTGLESINQAIKKYNLAYDYCLAGNQDLAVIQLKKLLSDAPNFLRARLLLALLYMDDKKWDLADQQLYRCLKVDHNNTMALRYLKEVEAVLDGDDRDKRGDEDDDGSFRYNSGTELIIQPTNVREPRNSGVGTLINIVIGLVLGMAAMYFLVLPARMTQVREESQGDSKVLGEQLDDKTSRIQELEQQLSKLETENTALNGVIEGYTGEDGTLKNIDLLLDAATVYIETGDKAATAEKLEAAEATATVETMSESFQTLYGAIISAIGPELSVGYYNEGYSAFRSENYDTAIELLGKAVHYDATNADALFHLGEAYRKKGDTDSAADVFRQVVELFPDTDRAYRSQQYLNEIENNN